MKKPLFTGVCTALVTPFLDGKVNYPMLERLLQRQLEAGITAVVIAGTTGESATLSDAEKLSMIRRAKAFAGERMTVLAGTGSNDTEHTVALSRAAQDMGADGLLVVTPYYNKPSPQGLLNHYRAVARAVEIPVIAYNVPSRTGVDLTAETCRALLGLPNLVGIKEASRDIRKYLSLLSRCGGDFTVWCGNDDLTVPALALGAKGVISVASNLIPEEMRALAEAALDGDFDTAADLQLRLLPLTEALFATTNPVPVKAAMKILGYDCGICRAPLAPLPEEQRRNLLRLLQE